MDENYYAKLADVNIKKYIDNKGALKFLPWARAWDEVKRLYPDASYKIYTNPDIGGMPYFTDGISGMVHVSTTVAGVTHDEWRGILDTKNSPVPAAEITAANVTAAIQRAITKSLARHGIGISLYYKDDEESGEKPAPTPYTPKTTAATPSDIEETWAPDAPCEDAKFDRGAGKKGKTFKEIYDEKGERSGRQYLQYAFEHFNGLPDAMKAKLQEFLEKYPS